MPKILLVYYQLESASRLQPIRKALQAFGECKHYDDNITFIKTDQWPADMEDWFRMELLQKESFFITTLTFSASTKPPETGAFGWVNAQRDGEFENFISQALSEAILRRKG